jgi:hypothetical protein
LFVISILITFVQTVLFLKILKLKKLYRINLSFRPSFFQLLKIKSLNYLLWTRGYRAITIISNQFSLIYSTLSFQRLTIYYLDNSGLIFLNSVNKFVCYSWESKPALLLLNPFLGKYTTLPSSERIECKHSPIIHNFNN